MARSFQRRIVCVLALLLAACRDSPTEPLATLVRSGDDAALEVLATLPTLPRLLETEALAGRLARPGALSQARDLWAQGEALGDSPAARALREEAFTLVARELGPTADSTLIAGVLADLERWLAAASAPLGSNAPAELRAIVADGRRLADEARAAWAASDAAATLLSVLRAADRMDAATPVALARRLIHGADEALRTRKHETGANVWRADPELRRADRLLRGARSALERGDVGLAIRRAHYAGQLLGGD